jgi:nicotinamidase-related amidase
MPLDIDDLVLPGKTAIVINECQQGILGEDSSLPVVAEATRWIIPNVGRLVRSARHYGVDVMHAVAGRRPDGRGGMTGPVVERHLRPQTSLDVGEYSTVMPEIGVEPSDFVVTRYGGMGGLSASGAVSILRGLGVSTVVLAGVTLNAGVLTMMSNAIDEGFAAVVVSDACGGFPKSYGEDVLKYTVRFFAPIVSVEQLEQAWSRTTSLATH